MSKTTNTVKTKNKAKDENVRKIIIRLYRQFDIDLLYIYSIICDNDIDIQRFTKDALRCYIRGNKPHTLNDILEHIRMAENAPSLTIKRKAAYHLKLDLKEDADIIAWIEGIRKGYRNSAIKGAYRDILGPYRLYPSLITTKVTLVGKDAKNIDGADEQI